MKRLQIIIGIIPLLADFVSALLAWTLAFYLRPLTDLIPFIQSEFSPELLPSIDFFIPFVFFSSLSLVILFAFLGFYKIKEKFESGIIFFQTILGVFLWGMLIVSYFSLVRHEPVFSRVMLFQALIFTTAAILLFRFFIFLLAFRWWKKGFLVKRVFLIGRPEEIKNFQKNISMPFAIVGSLIEKEINHLKKIINRQKIDEIWQVSEKISPKNILFLKEFCAEKHFAFRFVPQNFSFSFAKMQLEMIGSQPILKPIGSNLDGWGRALKRFFDFFFAFLALILLIPFFIFIALAIKIDSKGSIFFKQKRIGREGKIFYVYKFRSMVFDAEKKKKKLLKNSHRSDGPFFKIKNDPRITKIGKKLRRFSLDELPQLFNVLKGDMSLTGPRPHLENEISKFTPWQKRILQVRPGITGLSQVSGRSNLAFAKEIELDLFFIQNWNFFLEIKILLKTIFVVLQGKGAD